MKLMAAAIMAIAISALASARAQTAERWVDPTDHFSLDYRSLGWSEVTTLPPEPGEILTVEHRAFQADGLMRTCGITQRTLIVPPAPGLDQEGANAFAASRTAADFERLVQNPPTHLSHVEIDGIEVSDVTFSEPLYMHMRMFYIYDGSQLIQFLINCGANPPVPAQVEDNITALLNTLHFERR